MDVSLGGQITSNRKAPQTQLLKFEEFAFFLCYVHTRTQFSWSKKTRTTQWGLVVHSQDSTSNTFHDRKLSFFCKLMLSNGVELNGLDFRLSLDLFLPYPPVHFMDNFHKESPAIFNPIIRLLSN